MCVHCFGTSCLHIPFINTVARAGQWALLQGAKVDISWPSILRGGKQPWLLAALLTLVSDFFQRKWNGTVCRLQGKEEKRHFIFLTTSLLPTSLNETGVKKCRVTAVTKGRAETPTHLPQLYFDIAFFKKPHVTSKNESGAPPFFPCDFPLGGTHLLGADGCCTPALIWGLTHRWCSVSP